VEYVYFYSVDAAGDEARRINVDFTPWKMASLNRVAWRLGVTRQSIIKMWLAECLQQGG